MTAAHQRLPEAAYAAALATLDGMGARTLYRLLEAQGPAAAWEQVRRGEFEREEGAQWRDEAAGTDVAAVWAAHRQLGIGVVYRGGPRFPPALDADVDAPGAVFHLGDPEVIGPHPRVAIVGTRSATRYGLGVAAQLGADLAAGGVTVVSGLAVGIDGAAHEGACAGQLAAGADGAPPVAVVAGGLDRPYPARHAGLWQRVAEQGVVLSTSPVGVAVERWRFPNRNRMIAALGHVVVVVESHHAGGSLHTAREGEKRGRLVGAVPGSVRSPASGGTNDLLADGCFPVRDVADVQAALELMLAGRPLRPRAVATATGSAAAGRAANSPGPTARAAATPGDRDADHEALARTVRRALAQDRCSVDQLLRRTGLELGVLCTVLERLQAEGRVTEDGGWWEDG